MSKTRRLGRGLGALIQAADTTEVHKKEDRAKTRKPLSAGLKLNWIK